MNSEIRLGILKDEEKNNHAKHEAQKAKEVKIVNEASDAVSFERHPFWQMMKTDLEEVRQKIVDRVINDDTLNEVQRNQYRLEAKNIRLFLDHPKLYVKKLNDFLAKKYPERKRGIMSWLKPQPQ